jgi:flavin reductase (DIM6/NTAB) family NADH-FMN oxidoreductase RutF
MSATAIQTLAPELDDGALRTAFGRFPTGVTFVTTDAGDAPLGLIVSSFAAVSLRPPLVSFCPSRDSLTWQRMRQAGRFTIHVLEARHGGWVRRAAPSDADRFADPSVVRDALTSLVCDLEAEHAAGDHTIVVGRVRSLVIDADARPLVYFAGRFGRFVAD